MYCKKTLFLKPEQKKALEDIQKEVKENGGNVSCMRLMQDSINIFIDHYSNEAIDKYSSNYAKKGLN